MNTWKTGQQAQGEYCGIPYRGKLADTTRPTPDFANTIFVIDLDEEITVYGQQRQRIEVWTNAATNSINLAA